VSAVMGWQSRIVNAAVELLGQHDAGPAHGKCHGPKEARSSRSRDSFDHPAARSMAKLQVLGSGVALPPIRRRAASRHGAARPSSRINFAGPTAVFWQRCHERCFAREVFLTSWPLSAEREVELRERVFQQAPFFLRDVMARG